MKTHLRLIVAFFLAGFAFLGQSCVEEETPLERFFPVWETDNWAALQLQRQLQEQPTAFDEFLASLNDEKPFYSGIRLISMPDCGLCYFIPYGGDKVEGAIFYPLDSEMREDGTYLLKGNLHSPENVDARRLNEDIPITQRFLYSAQFQVLQKQGMEVLPALVACAEALNGKSVPISERESSFTLKTRANGDMVSVLLIFSELYYGSVTSDGEPIVYSLSPEELEDMTRQAIQVMNGFRRVELEYVPHWMIYFGMLREDMHCVRTFIV